MAPRVHILFTEFLPGRYRVHSTPVMTFPWNRPWTDNFNIQVGPTKLADHRRIPSFAGQKLVQSPRSGRHFPLDGPSISRRTDNKRSPHHRTKIAIRLSARQLDVCCRPSLLNCTASQCRFPRFLCSIELVLAVFFTNTYYLSQTM